MWPQPPHPHFNVGGNRWNPRLLVQGWYFVNPSRTLRYQPQPWSGGAGQRPHYDDCNVMVLTKSRPGMTIQYTRAWRRKQPIVFPTTGPIFSLQHSASIFFPTLGRPNDGKTNRPNVGKTSEPNGGKTSGPNVEKKRDCAWWGHRHYRFA